MNGTAPPCPYCGIPHISRCPSVKAFEYHPNGTIKRVEFVTGADYPAWTKFHPNLTGAQAAGVNWQTHDAGKVAFAGFMTTLPPVTTK